MKDDGFIKIYRSSVNSKLYMSEPFTKWQAWCDLIILAQYSDSTMYVRGIRIDTKRGCVYMSSDNLAKRWKWSRGKVLRFLSELETIRQIVQQKSNVINCISVTNYDKYQSDGTTNGTANGTTSQKKVTKKSKEEDKEKESSLRSDSTKSVDDELSFDKFWDLYDKKVGKDKAISLYENLSRKDKEAIFKHVPLYKMARPDKQYRKDPQTYLRNHSWNDEIITSKDDTRLLDNNTDKFKDGFSW